MQPAHGRNEQKSELDHTFAARKHELGLKRFLASTLGTLYFAPDAPAGRSIIVRHFDSKLAPEYVEPYAGLIEAVGRWIEERPELSALVRVERIREAGIDSVVRPHHVYYVSSRDYDDQEEPIEAPPQFLKMRDTVRELLARDAGATVAIVRRVVVNSLLRPTDKLFFEGAEAKFILVEPKLVPEDVVAWARRT